MEFKSKLTSNYIFNLLNRIILLIIPLITTPYLTRVLGTEELGIYNYMNTIASYFVMSAMMGMPILGTKEISLARDSTLKNKVASKLLLIQIINTLVAVVLYIIYIKMIDYSNKHIAILQILFIISAIFDISWFLQGIENFKTITLRNVMVNIITTILILCLVKNKEDLIIYTLIKSGCVFISQIALMSYCIKYIKWVKPKLNDLKNIYKELFVLFIPVIAENVFHNLDRVMLGVYISYSSVAIYYISRMITDMPQCFASSINTIIYPRITYLINRNNEIEHKKLTYYSFEIINLLCVGMAFGISAIAKEFINLYLGKEYQSVAECIPWLAPYIVLAAWNMTIRYQYLLPKSMNKIYSKAIMIGILCNIILNIVLIKRLEIIGVILATVISEFIIAVIQSKKAFKEMELFSHIKNLFFYILSGISMYRVIIVINKILYFDLLIKIVIEVLIGIIFYITLAIILINIIDKKIHKMFLEIYKR